MKMSDDYTIAANHSICTAILAVFMSLIVSALADFAEATPVHGPEQASRTLLQGLDNLRPDGNVMSLREADADSILTVGKTRNGVLLSLNVSHFRMKGHGDTANGHEYLIDFPVRPPPNASPVKIHFLPLEQIVPRLNKDFIPFKMVTHAMRRRDSKELSWASSRLLIELKDSASAEKILPDLIAIIYKVTHDRDFFIFPSRRENEP